MNNKTPEHKRLSADESFDVIRRVTLRVPCGHSAPYREGVSAETRVYIEGKEYRTNPYTQGTLKCDAFAAGCLWAQRVMSEAEAGLNPPAPPYAADAGEDATGAPSN
jgi:hypothetical protein